MNQPAQQQDAPGLTDEMTPRPDHGEKSYVGSGRLKGKIALVTGADSGIGKAVALAFAREGADVVVSYLEEHEDANNTRDLIEAAGRKALLVPGDLSTAEHSRRVISSAVAEFGRIDVLVHNAAFQRTHESIEEIENDEWDYTIATNLSAYFYLVKAALPHMGKGAAIIATSSVQADSPSPQLLPYAATKAAITNMTASLSQMLAERGIRANVVAPGPIWTPLIPSTMPEDQVAEFGAQVPMGRPGQPAEVAAPYVMLASDEASYISGAEIAVTGGKPIL